MKNPPINKELCIQYLNQLEVIRILFFAVRTKGILSPEQKRQFKKKLKGAQRQLENLKGNRTKRIVGDLIATHQMTVDFWKNIENVILLAIDVKQRLDNMKHEQSFSYIQTNILSAIDPNNPKHIAL